MKKKILCIGDSLTLPGHTNLYEDTWFQKLKQQYSKFDFISVFRRGITTNILVTEGGGDKIDNLPKGADCLEHYNPDIIVLQLGIVDCAPRLIKRHSIESMLVSRMPSNLQNVYIKIIKKFRERSNKKASVSHFYFEHNLRLFFERSVRRNVKKVIIIKIPVPNYKMINKNPNIIAAVELYNKIYDNFLEQFNFLTIINPLDSRKYNYDIFEDGYHPNAMGHKLIYTQLKQILNNFE